MQRFIQRQRYLFGVREYKNTNRSGNENKFALETQASPTCLPGEIVQSEFMNLDRIREKLSNGFHPFVLETSIGKRVSVLHPDFVIVGKGVVVVMGEDDSLTTLDSRHIASMEDLPGPKRRK